MACLCALQNVTVGSLAAAVTRIADVIWTTFVPRTPEHVQASVLLVGTALTARQVIFIFIYLFIYISEIEIVYKSASKEFKIQMWKLRSSYSWCFHNLIYLSVCLSVCWSHLCTPLKSFNVMISHLIETLVRPHVKLHWVGPSPHIQGRFGGQFVTMFYTQSTNKSPTNWDDDDDDDDERMNFNVA